MATEKSPKLKRIKEYPNPLEVGKRAGAVALGTAAGTVVGLGALHAGLDFINATPIHDIFIIGGASEWAAHGMDWTVTHGINIGGNHLTGGTNDLAVTISQGVDKAADHVSVAGMHAPHGIAEAVPNLLSHVSESPFGKWTHITADDMVVAEGAGIATGAISGALNTLKLIAPARTANVPEQGAYEAASEVMDNLSGKSKMFGLTHPFSRLDSHEIAVEVEATFKDLKKADISKEAVWANTAGHVVAALPIFRLPSIQQAAVRATLKKEEYKRMKGGGFIGSVLNFGDSKAGIAIKNIPGIGNGFDALSNLTEATVGRLFPKRDIFGNAHGAFDAGALDIMATLIGTFAPLPLLTSTDVKEFVELVARPMFESDVMDSEIYRSAAIIVGDRVHHTPRAFSRRGRN